MCGDIPEDWRIVQLENYIPEIGGLYFTFSQVGLNIHFRKSDTFVKPSQKRIAFGILLGRLGLNVFDTPLKQKLATLEVQQQQVPLEIDEGNCRRQNVDCDERHVWVRCCV
jgi:hypothetical protein